MCPETLTLSATFDLHKGTVFIFGKHILMVRHFQELTAGDSVALTPVDPYDASCPRDVAFEV